MIEPWFSELGYAPFILLTAIGVYMILSLRNFIRALVGLQVLQAGVILFFILMAVKEGADVPILRHAHGETGHAHKYVAAEGGIENPIPQALMLTAIVVGVATQGVGLAILRRIRQETGSIEDPQSRGDAD